MRRISRLLPALVVTVLLSAVPAHAASWTLGTNLGLAYFSPKGGGDGITMLMVPGSAGQIVPGFMPGLRLGAVDESTRNETYFEQGFSLLSSGGSSLSAWQGTANYQFNLASGNPTTPFLGIGAGVLHLGSGFSSSTVPVLGGGLGVRHILAHKHGAVRGELHLDWYGRETSGFVGGTAIAVKLGFDLFVNMKED